MYSLTHKSDKKLFKEEVQLKIAATQKMKNIQTYNNKKLKLLIAPKNQKEKKSSIIDFK